MISKQKKRNDKKPKNQAFLVQKESVIPTLVRKIRFKFETSTNVIQKVEIEKQIFDSADDLPFIGCLQKYNYGHFLFLLIAKKLKTSCNTSKKWKN